MRIQGICTFCWFACDVTVAMLDGKNNNLFLRWELNFVITQILRKEMYCIAWPI